MRAGKASGDAECAAAVVVVVVVVVVAACARENRVKSDLVAGANTSATAINGSATARQACTVGSTNSCARTDGREVAGDAAAAADPGLRALASAEAAMVAALETVAPVLTVEVVVVAVALGR